MSTKLDVLVIDRVQSSGDLLRDSLRSLPEMVTRVTRVNSLPDGRRLLEERPFNSVFIDPLSFGLDEGAQFIFNLRTAYPNIVFVLYVDFNEIQTQAEEDDFYAGDRKRLKHYYKLNKATAAIVFRDELIAVVKECQ